jgi:redox-sensitive bicupin YhaK (pirin superfamily)
VKQDHWRGVRRACKRDVERDAGGEADAAELYSPPLQGRGRGRGSAVIHCHSPTLYAAIDLQPGASLELDREADERALYLLNGDASVDGEPLGVQHLVILAPGTRPVLRSANGGRLMLCGGAPMDGERHVWWNFVSSSRERINEAKRAWKAGEFALPPEDNGEFIPLPEIPTTVSYP